MSAGSIVHMTRTGGTDVRAIVDDFVVRLTGAIEAHIGERIRTTVLSAMGVGARRGPGRPPKTAQLPAAVMLRKATPRQLCPVPGCSNPAAPVFGMVCAEHKDVPREMIKKYRDARRAALETARTKIGVQRALMLKGRPAPGPKPVARAVSARRRLQGQYMGTLRGLTGEARQRVKATAKEKGVAEALKLAQSLQQPA
jgi:hypothetical protein